MAQLTLGTGNSKPKLVSPPGYEVVDVGTATEAISSGQLVVRTASGWSKAPAGTQFAHGVALKDYIAGQGGCDFLIQGEMDGYDASGGITPGAPIYPSASVAGGLQTDVLTVATTPAVTVTPQIRAATATRLRFNFV